MKSTNTTLAVEAPGIISLFLERPEIAEPMKLLAQTLLRPVEDNGLPFYMRERLASYASSLNHTTFCQLSHGAAANAMLASEGRKTNEIPSEIEKQCSIVVGRTVFNQPLTKEERQRYCPSLTNEQFFDCVTIASAFSMFNRFVKCLGVDSPGISFTDYMEMGKEMAEKGYL